MRPSLKGTVIRGAAGTYAVCFELSRRGWLVVPTYGNSPGIDIFASKNGRTIGIQVKIAMKENDGWIVPQPERIHADLYYVFVAAADIGLPTYWILKGSEVPSHCDNHPKVNIFHFRNKPAERQSFLERWNILEPDSIHE